MGGVRHVSGFRATVIVAKEGQIWFGEATTRWKLQTKLHPRYYLHSILLNHLGKNGAEKFCGRSGWVWKQTKQGQTTRTNRFAQMASEILGIFVDEFFLKIRAS